MFRLAGWRIRGVKPSSTVPDPYVVVLGEVAGLYRDVRRLETRVLQLMQECGVTDEQISDVMGISPQAVGKKRRRRV